MHFPQCMASLTLACIFLPFEFVKSTSINLHSHSLWPRSAPLHSTPSSCALRFWRLHLRRLVLHARFHFWSWAAAAAARKYEKSSSYTRSTKKQRAWLRGAGEVAEERKKSCGSHCQLPSSVSIVCDSLGDVIRPRIFPNPKPLKTPLFHLLTAPAPALAPDAAPILVSGCIICILRVALHWEGWKVATLFGNVKRGRFPWR